LAVVKDGKIIRFSAPESGLNAQFTRGNVDGFTVGVGKAAGIVFVKE
jgi:hypothetical protein